MNLPNKLTVARVLSVPVFMVFAYLAEHGQAVRIFSFLAGAVFALACITDYLDGHIARKNNLVTDFGKFADPLADKMLTTAAFIYMTVAGVCSPVVLAVILFREFAVAGVRMIAASGSKVIAANFWGKLKTVMQMVTVMFWYFMAAITPSDWGFVMILLTKIMCWIVAAATIVSGAKYIWDNKEFINTTK